LKQLHPKDFQISRETALVEECSQWTRRALQLGRRVDELEDAMRRIQAIKNSTTGGDWDEIEEARAIAASVCSTAQREGK
jgi:hypothetical protein